MSEAQINPLTQRNPSNPEKTMDTNFRIFAVDDVPATRQILEASLGKVFAVESFASAEECLERLDQQSSAPPNLFLLDVGLPGIDGYELCRKIKGRENTAHVPVIFISGLDDLDSRLKGYDAGGEEFIVKPYKMADLKQKIEVIRNFINESNLLRQQANESETLTSLILSNLDEYAVLIKFLREMNLSATPTDVATAAFNMLRGFHLNGALQIRMGQDCLTLSPDGNSNPLEESVINLLRDGDRIVQFKSRAVFNFEHLTLLTTNFPAADTELAGRLRDHLAIAVECADSRLLMLQVTQLNQNTRSGITELVASLDVTVSNFNNKFDEARAQASQITYELLEELTLSFARLGLSESQENHVRSFIEVKAYKLSDAFEFAGETSQTLHDLRARLSELMKAT